jgi:hypothetical protein
MISKRRISLPPARHPGTKLAQDRKVETGISQFEGKRILPINTLLDRLGSLSIRQAFNELEDANQSESQGASAG